MAKSPVIQLDEAGEETHLVLPQKQPQRRTLWALTLAVTPLLVASSALAAAGYWNAAIDPGFRTEAVVVPAASFDRPALPVTAPGDPKEVDLTSEIPTIKIVYPPPPEPARYYSNNRSSRSGGGSGGGSGNYQTFCPTGAGASITSGSASAQMKAVNAERARLGIAPLSWSSSLASASQKWAQSMANTDSATPELLGNALAHNPNRPSGGENVGMSYSNGRTAAQAQHIVHANYMKSSSHCKNLMNPKWTRMGAGIAQASNGVWYLAQNFQ